MRTSKVVSAIEEKLTIKLFFEEKGIRHAKLLYRASEENFSIQKFHENCDGVGDTLTVIETEFSKKIGGFTSLEWKSPFRGEWPVDNPKESFIFSITHRDKLVLVKPENAIYNSSSFGPAFGSDCGLYVCDNANYKFSFGNVGSSYQN